MSKKKQPQPIRIQRKRTKGWRLESPNGLPCVYVGRGSKWGNPFILEGDQIFVDAGYRRKVLDKWVYLAPGDSEYLLLFFEKIIERNKFADPDLQYWSDYFHKLDFSELKGKNLVCWCPINRPCHADILMNLANKY
jgi:hypothetical protein